MPLQTPVTRALGVEHPVVLAPMDRVADARLCLAVLDGGGFPFLGGGYGDEAWLRGELATLAPDARKRGRPFGVGFITWSLARQPHLLDIALAAGPAAIFLSFGDVGGFAPRIRAAGARVVCQVQTEAMARAALDQGADILVAQGGEAGGHGVSRGTLALVPAIADLAGPDVPLLAAGGIADGRGLAACLMLGAGGVVLGTRFYASVEAAGDDVAKKRIVEATGDETMRSVVFDISRRNVWPAPFTGRCIENAHLRRWAGRELDLLRASGTEAEAYAQAREAKDYEVAAVIAGEGCGLVHGIAPARAIIEGIVKQALELLARAPGLAR